MIDPMPKVVSFVDEFKKFALKGNVIDLAVAVIIGAAFTKIVDSLVKDIIMPMISAVMPGEQGYLGWHFTINGVTVGFGRFLGEVVNFLLVALVLYVFFVKFIGWLRRARKDEETVPALLTKEQELLIEIRDLLKTNRGLASNPATRQPE